MVPSWEEVKDESSDNFEALYTARKYFQYGITLIMADDITEGISFLETFQAIFLQEPPDILKYTDYIRSYIVHWLTQRRDEKNILVQASVKIEKELLKKAVHYSSMDLYQSIKKCKFFSTQKDDITTFLPFFEKECRDFYPYKDIGDSLMGIARIRLILEHPNFTLKAINSAQSLYHKALKKIPQTLTQEKAEWDKFADLSDKNIRETKSEDAKEYLERRQNMRGLIPLYRRQGQIIKEICSVIFSSNALSTYSSERWSDIQTNFEKFFNEIINPKNKKESVLGFIEEMEWFLIKVKFHINLFKDISTEESRYDILRKCLG